MVTQIEKNKDTTVIGTNKEIADLKKQIADAIEAKTDTGGLEIKLRELEGTIVADEAIDKIKKEAK